MDTLQLVNGYVESNVRTLLKYTLAHNIGLVNAQYFATDGNRIIEPSNDSTLVIAGTVYSLLMRLSLCSNHCTSKDPTCLRMRWLFAKRTAER